MTRKSRPARSCPMCKPWKWAGNSQGRESRRARDVRQEQAADADYAAGRTRVFQTGEEFLAELDEWIAEGEGGRHGREEVPGR